MQSVYTSRAIQLAGIVTLFSAFAAAGTSELLAQCTDCSCRDCGNRQQLFGDWLGLRSGLAEHGIIADLYQMNHYQGVATGGVEQTSKYGGKLHYEFTFEGEKLGLNKGLIAMMHAETRFGEDINRDAGALAFPNTDMLFPFPERDLTAIPGLFVIQALNDRIALTAGKYRTLDLFNMIYPDAHVRGVDGFMNLNLLLPLTLFRTTDLSINAAGLLGMKGKQVQSGMLVYDPKNVSTTIAPDLFGEPLTARQVCRLHWN